MTDSALAGELLPARKSLKHRHNLARLDGCRAEMAAVYREARNGRIELGDATRLVYVLAQIARVLELSEIERRLDRLEELQHERQLCDAD